MATSEMVQGMRACRAAFKALPQVAKDAFLPAIEITVKEIARQAQARLLSSPSIQTRALHDHVAAKVIKASGRGIVGVSTGSTVIRRANRKAGITGLKVKGIIVAGKGGGAVGSYLDKPSKRGHFVEFGTRTMPAEPFMIPAAESEQGAFLSRCQVAGRTIERDVAAIGSRNL